MLQIPPQKLKEILIKDNLITAEKFEGLLLEAKRMDQNIVDFLISGNFVTADYFYNLAARYFGVERANLAGRNIEENILRKLSEELARQKRIIIFNQESDGVLDSAMEDPSDLEAIEFLERRLKSKIKPFLATPEDLNRGFALYGRRMSEDFKKIIEENINATLRKKTESVEEAAKDVPIVAIVDSFMSYAISLRASDIHIEILEDTILIRYRVDGVLHEIARIPKEVYPAIVARI